MSSIDFYDIGEFLGSGGFASVHRARCRTTDRQCALKIMDKAVMREHGALRRIQNEIKLHGIMAHANIVQLLGHFEDETHIYMVLELCEGGNLFKLLRQTGPLAEDEAGHISYQILRAVAYMHSNGVVHRDLKLSNILVSDSATMSIKLCDFGLAVQLQHPDEEHFTLCGTPNYIAPEIAGQSAYGYPADLWSVGCLFYCMVTGMSPFEQRDVSTTLQRILTGQYAVPTFLSAEGLDFLHRLLQMDPLKRPSAQQISSHPFIVKCSSAYSGMAADIAGKLAIVTAAAEKERRKRRRRRKPGSLNGSFARSSGDDTEQVPWIVSAAESCSRSSSQALPSPHRCSSPNTSMTSSNSRDIDATRGGLISQKRNSDSHSAGSVTASTDGGDRVQPRFLLSSFDADGTIDLSLRKEVGTEESQLLRRAIASSAKGKMESSRDGVSFLSLSRLCPVTSVNSSVDSAASVAFCRSKGSYSAARQDSVSMSSRISSRRGHLTSASTVLPLLQPPKGQAVMHSSSCGDLLICSVEGDIVFCTALHVKATAINGNGASSEVPVRVLINKRTRTKISVSRLTEETAREQRRIVERSQPAMGFSFLTEDEALDISKSCLWTPNFSEKMYSIRGAPDWITVKYMKIARILVAVRCRMPKLVLYVTSAVALKTNLRPLTLESGLRLPSDSKSDSNPTVYCKCMVMCNDPLPDFCVQWADGVKLRYSLASGRLHLSSPADPPGLPLYKWEGDRGGKINNGPDGESLPSWAATAADSVKEYLLVAQAAMERCLVELEALESQIASSSSSNSIYDVHAGEKIIII